MKILAVRGKRAIIVAARRMDPVIYDLETEEALCTLTSNIPSSSFYSITTAGHYVFCCDANKNVFRFDINSDKPLCQTDIRKFLVPFTWFVTYLIDFFLLLCSALCCNKFVP